MGTAFKGLIAAVDLSEVKHKPRAHGRLTSNTDPGCVGGLDCDAFNVDGLAHVGTSTIHFAGTFFTN